MSPPVEARKVEGELVSSVDAALAQVATGPLEKKAGIGGGAFGGASTDSRALASWRPQIVSPDQALNRDKLILDNRGRDLMRNTGPMLGAANVHMDSIVGSQFRLNLDPAYNVLRRATGLTSFDEVWAEEFQEEVEELFTLYAESDQNWIDTTAQTTLTGLVRMAICVYFSGGEVVATSDWIKERGRPFSTAFQIVDADRVCNPNDVADTKYLKRGVVLNSRGAPTDIWIRKAYQNDPTAIGGESYQWEKRPVRLKWGRLNTLFLRRTTRPEQTRGVADMVSILKEARMADRFHETTLANAIVNASYAATIESELPPEMAYEMLGAGQVPNDAGTSGMSYLQAIAAYSRGGKNIELDGTKIPYLFPGSKLKMLPAGTVGGIGTDFEESLNRYVSAGLGISYEEYTHDFTKTNYSSAKAAANNTLRAMQARKREVADRTANAIAQNFIEEAIDRNLLSTLSPMLRKRPDLFYEGMNKDALCRATWIGSSRGQVDELKETQAALLRIKSGLSTWENECARLGQDFRDVYRQRAREDRMQKKLGLSFDSEPTKPGTMSGERSNNQQGADNGDDADE